MAVFFHKHFIKLWIIPVVRYVLFPVLVNRDKVVATKSFGYNRCECRALVLVVIKLYLEVG